ncbi:hypothetical protein AVEN_271251-1 [Araneus ventricosus]|uniref:Uncharacterized protein n=1 Tax=Araneus ventricosus TaxID=182803 RepID=A0A4Y2G3B9_ARAVE|nr:hypothetical protein AVEN_271251-1 [Araneus ventricosus]
MCLDMCRSEYAKAVRGCDEGRSMVSSVRDLCIGGSKRPNISSEQKVELQDKRLICFQNCKQGCLTLRSPLLQISPIHRIWLLLLGGLIWIIPAAYFGSQPGSGAFSFTGISVELFSALGNELSLQLPGKGIISVRSHFLTLISKSILLKSRIQRNSL